MNPYFSTPADPQPGDYFHLSYNCLHFDGRVCHLEPAANAVGKVGHVVIWEYVGKGVDHGKLFRTRWSTFREHARRVVNPESGGAA